MVWCVLNENKPNCITAIIYIKGPPSCLPFLSENVFLYFTSSYLLNLFSHNSDVHSYNTRGRSNIHLNRISSKSGSRSFSYAAAELFNDLPDLPNYWFEKWLCLISDVYILALCLSNYWIYLFICFYNYLVHSCNVNKWQLF